MQPKMRTLLLIVFIAITAIIAFVIARNQPNKPLPQSLESPVTSPNYVVASIAPLADIVRQIAGDRMQVHTLLPPGASPHTFETTPAELILLSKAKAFFKIGWSLEFWADKLVNSLGHDQLRVITVSAGIPTIFSNHHHDDIQPQKHGENVEHHEHTTTSKNDDEDIEVNPHFWLDPINAMQIANNARDGLIAMDISGREEYVSNTTAFIQKLNNLHGEYEQTLSQLRARRFVVFHNAYAYLAQRYKLEIIGIIEPSPGKEPSAKHLATLIDDIKNSHATAVLVEPQFNPRLGEVIAAETGIKLITIDPLGNPLQPETMTYIGLMKFNLHQLKSAFDGKIK
ncbi:MAG: zinc ABC transporter substrate-binding protein [Deltaproteobacteria bacterium]|nr:zinc ABC transporter substrate-binding protein [Deltaproteobacteria bacterium]